MGVLDWLKGGAKRGASIAFADRFDKMEERLLTMEKQHELILYRLDK